MNKITENKSSIILENSFVKITIEKKSAKVRDIVEKATGKSIKGEDTNFFYFIDDDKNVILSDIELDGNNIAVSSGKLSATVEVKAFENYFTFEVKSEIKTNKLVLAHAKYIYDADDTSSIGAVDVNMTINMNPVFYPDSYDKETRGECRHKFGTKGAKLALVIAPISSHQDILKQVLLTVDKKKGFCYETCGPWGIDYKPNHGDYVIAYDTRKEFIEKSVDRQAEAGVDQVDYHQGMYTYRQGDFKFMCYPDGKEFRKNVSDVLAKKGMEAGLHTYAFYILPECDELLANAKYHKDLRYNEIFTLKKDISANDTFIPTNESTAELSSYYGFFTKNIPYVLIGDEIIKYENAPDGFKTCTRGYSGTKPTAHKKGEKVYHLEGFFYMFCPEPGSDLFLEVARRTAKAYNEGGFGMIYLDAIDGMHQHCDPDEHWYYDALFAHEILSNCKTAPIIEYSDFHPTLWAARGRMGAWDTPYRSYKDFIKLHTENNKRAMRRFYTATLGWYNFYPQTDVYPGNQHTKYHHTDAIDCMGSIAVAYDFTTVFNPLALEWLDRFEGFRRNIKRYKMYSDLRKSHYFPDSILKQIREDPDGEYAVEKKKNGKYVFVEKHYETKRYYSFNEDGRNIKVFDNPFRTQKPFIRIEADMSSFGNEPEVLLSLDENTELTKQGLKREFGAERDFSKKLSMKAKVFGNGKNGKVCIRTKCASNSEFGVGTYIIDVDFEGWREFMLTEADNGERHDHGFEKNDGLYKVYRSGLQENRLIGVEVLTEGDMTGVKMGDIIAVEQAYNILKNPTVEIGDKKIFFECELMSTDFIEYDGKKAVAVDRYGNERPVFHEGEIELKKGKNTVKLTAESLNKISNNAHLTFGVSGREVK